MDSGLLCSHLITRSRHPHQSINQINLHWKSSTSESRVTFRLVWPTALPVSITSSLWPGCASLGGSGTGLLREFYGESWTYQNGDLLITKNHHKLNPFKSTPSKYYQQQRLFLYIVIHLFFVIMALFWFFVLLTSDKIITLTFWQILGTFEQLGNTSN